MTNRFEERAILESQMAIDSFINRYNDQLLSETEAATFLRLSNDKPAEILNEWVNQGQAFRVRFSDDQYRYPAFQFDRQSSKPLAIMALILAQLRRVQGRNDWSIAVWFDSSNSWLAADSTPADQLTTDPERVLKAATQDAEKYEQ